MKLFDGEQNVIKNYLFSTGLLENYVKHLHYFLMLTADDFIFI